MDPAIITEVTSAGSLAISLVNLIISRWDKRSDELKHPDVISALRELEQELSIWVRQSTETNEIVQARIAGAYDWKRVQLAAQRQGSIAVRIRKLMDTGAAPAYETWANTWRKGGEVAQSLRIYAPEFYEEFQAAAKRRHDLLGYIILEDEEFFEGEAGLRELSEALTGSSLDLNRALSTLRQFMHDKITM